MGSLKIRSHGFSTGGSVVRILETTNFLLVTIRTRAGVLAGTSILATGTIVRAGNTTRANGSDAHAHGKVVSFDDDAPAPLPSRCRFTVSKPNYAYVDANHINSLVRAVLPLLHGGESIAPLCVRYNSTRTTAEIGYITDGTSLVYQNTRPGYLSTT
jgi:hypothetical protein